MNLISVHGNLSKDVEVITTESGLFILKGTLADNVGYGDKKKTNWIQFTRFYRNAPATGLVDRLVKGAFVIIHGHLEVNERKVNEKTYTNLEVITNHIEVVSTSKSSALSANEEKAEKVQVTTKKEEPKEEPEQEEELPF